MKSLSGWGRDGALLGASRGRVPQGGKMCCPPVLGSPQGTWSRVCLSTCSAPQVKAEVSPPHSFPGSATQSFSPPGRGALLSS